MQFILRNVMQSRRLGNSDKKTYKNVPLEINLATMEGEKRKTCFAHKLRHSLLRESL